MCFEEVKADGWLDGRTQNQDRPWPEPWERNEGVAHEEVAKYSVIEFKLVKTLYISVSPS